MSLFLAALLLGILSIVQVLVPPLVGLPFPLVGLAGLVLRLVVSALLLWLVGTVVPGFEVDGFGPALMGALVMTAFGWVLSTLLFFTAMPGLLAPR